MIKVTTRMCMIFKSCCFCLFVFQGQNIFNYFRGWISSVTVETLQPSVTFNCHFLWVSFFSSSKFLNPKPFFPSDKEKPGNLRSVLLYFSETLNVASFVMHRCLDHWLDVYVPQFSNHYCWISHQRVTNC